MFHQGFLSVFFETYFTIISFCLIFSVLIKLEEIFIFPDLEVMSCMWVSFCHLCAQWLQWETWIWSEHRLTALVGGRTWFGGDRTGCKPGLLQCSVPITILSGVSSESERLEQEPWCRCLSWVWWQFLPWFEWYLGLEGLGLHFFFFAGFIFSCCVSPVYRMGQGQRDWGHTTELASFHS